MAALACSALALSCLVLALGARDVSRLSEAAHISAPPTNPSTVSVLDFGAVADAKTDNTAAFARAVAAVAQTGGIVLVPSGQYALEGNLTIPNGVALVGTYQAPPCHDLRVSNGTVDVDGSQLLPRGSRGDAAGPPFITVLQSASVRGLAFWYPDVDPTVAPVPYPWTIALVGRNAAVMDVELLNSFNGIYAVDSPRHYIARVHGQPTNVGVYVDACHDVGRIENVHFNPWYSDAPAYLAWQQEHGVGFQLMDTDWEFVSNTFTISGGRLIVESQRRSLHLCVDVVGSCRGVLVDPGDFTVFERSGGAERTARRHCRRSLHECVGSHRSSECSYSFAFQF